MDNNLMKGWIKLPAEKLAELKLNGQITVDGQVITYSPKDTLYLTPTGSEVFIKIVTEDDITEAPLQDFVRLRSMSDFITLKETGSLVVDGKTITYDENGSFYVVPGVGIESLNLTVGEVDVVYDTDEGVTMNSQGVVNEDEPIDVEMNIPLVGSSEIVFDATEDGHHIQAHLDNDISNKINRALLTPIAPPGQIKLVAIDASGTQLNIALGEGLTIENGVLKVI